MSNENNKETAKDLMDTLCAFRSLAIVHVCEMAEKQADEYFAKKEKKPKLYDLGEHHENQTKRSQGSR